MKNVRSIFFLLVVTTIISCNPKPFVKAKFKFEKISDTCTNRQDYFRVESGFLGERYEFERCLNTNYSADDARTFRQGDTVRILLAKPSTQNALFKVTVDIDSYPKYNFVTVDDETFMVISSKD